VRVAAYWQVARRRLDGRPWCGAPVQNGSMFDRSSTYRLRGGLLAVALCAAWLSPGTARSQNWVEERWTAPFLTRATFPLADEAGLFDELQRLPGEVADLLQLPPPNEPVELYLFADKPTYAQHLAARWPEIPYRRAMFVKGSGPGMVYAYRSPELPVDLRHETTHALLHAVLPAVPLWLDEGLAEYFEVPAADRASRNPHQAGMNWSLRLGLIRDIASLERKRDLADMGRGEYRDAWAWVHFMLQGPPEARQELVAYLAELRTTANPESLSRRLQRRLPGLNQQFVRHFKEWKP
jgi:hypothetical protein